MRFAHFLSRAPEGRARWLFAMLAATAAMGARELLNDRLGNALPFVFAFPALVVVALFAGIRAGALCAALCVLWAAFSFHLRDPALDASLQLLIFLPSAAVIVLFCGVFGTSFRNIHSALQQPADAALVAGSHWSLRWFRLSMVLSIGLPSLFFAVAAWRSYDAAWSGAEITVDRSGRIAQEQAAKVFESTQSLARRAGDMVDAQQGELASRQQSLHRALMAISADIPQVQGVSVWDANGWPIATSRFYPVPSSVSIADRDYFQRQRDQRISPQISETMVGHLSGDSSFTFSERRETSAGQFAGVIAVALDPHYFDSFYRELAQTEPGLGVALLQVNGADIARYPESSPSQKPPPADSLFLQRVVAGGMNGPQRGRGVDGVERLFAFRKVSNYPVYVEASLPQEEVLRGWYRYLLVLSGFTFPTALALLLVTWLAMQRTQREMEVLARLNSEERLRARAESALKQAQKLEALGLLTGGVAHDFNNLLMVLSNHWYLLKRRFSGQGADASFAAIERTVQSGERLTRQLLAFSRRQPLRSEYIELQMRLPQIADLVRHTLQSTSLKVSVAIDTAAIHVDDSELELALLNLGVNARDAMPNGGRISLDARNAAESESPSPDRHYVLISFSDTGVGIPKEILDRVFEPFFTTKGPGAGTGLGLSQVFGFCAQSGGEARIDSEVGLGTTVRLLLPASQETRPAAVPNSALSVVHGNGQRLLLVEDNEGVAQTTMILLTELGYVVRRAADGTEALEQVSADPHFEAVLTDVVMPGGMSGLDLARQLRQLQPDLPVLLMTGYTNELTRAREENFRVLAKPVAPDVLGLALAEALASAAQLRSSSPDPSI